MLRKPHVSSRIPLVSESEFVGLKEYFEKHCETCSGHIDTRLTILEKTFEEKLAWVQRLHDDFAVSVKERLAATNEIKAALADQSARSPTRVELQDVKDRLALMLLRSEHEASQAMLSKDIRELLKAKDQIEGKASQTATNIAVAVSVLALLLSAINAIAHFVIVP